MFLFSTEIFAFASFAQTQQIAVEPETRVRVRNPDGSMIDPKKQLVSFLLPARIPFAGREINDLQVVLIWISKIERLDSGRGFNRCGQGLWPGGNELNFERT